MPVYLFGGTFDGLHQIVDNCGQLLSLLIINFPFSGTNNKENINRNGRKHDKTKMDKSKGGTKVSNGSQKTANGTHNSNGTTNTESHKNKHLKQINHHITDVDDDDEDDEEDEDDEIDEFEELDNDALSSDNERKVDSPSLRYEHG